MSRKKTGNTIFKSAAGALNALLLSAFILLPVSCSGKPEGYGVLLWSHDEEALATGTLLPVRERSQRLESVVVELPDGGGTMTLPAWRLRIFSDPDEAGSFAAEYENTKGLYARSLRNALPVRDKPDRLARRVYKLANGEVMKVLERVSGEAVDEAGFTGTWYRVLTNEGVEGYSFDYYLSLFDPSAPKEASPSDGAAAGGGDAVIERFLANVWRPDSFRAMIDEETVNLTFFRKEYGIFPDPEAGVVGVNVPGHRAEFPFERITRTSRGEYLLDGSPFRFSAYGDTSLSVQYSHGGRQYSGMFVLLDEDVDEVIEKETERRDALYRDLQVQGRTLVSNAYGTIRLEKDRRFLWTGFERLVPGTVPREARGSGRIEFSRFLPDEMAGTYDGVMSLHFDGTPEYGLVHFLYTVEPGGVRLSALSDTDIERYVVKSPGIAPLIIYLSYSQEE